MTKPRMKRRVPATQEQFNEAVVSALQEIVSCLCYQPEVPMDHKTDMANKVNDVAKLKVEDIVLS